jgi:hypothetical protein
MDSTSSGVPLPIGRPGLAAALTALAVGLLLAAIALLILQVEVTHEGEVSGASAQTTRTCGSAFDGVADRSGWEVWWAHDLDEPDEAVRAALVRTRQCPDAINRRIVLSAVLMAGAASAAAGATRLRRTRTLLHDDDVVGRIARLGRMTSYVGVALTVAGAGALALLLADAESTLFLYTDRPVVAVGGLIVLVPAVALIVLGRALALLERAPRAITDRSPVTDPAGTDA